MNKITLEVEDKNLETLLTIVNSLKDDLVVNIKVEANNRSKKHSKYVPKLNKVTKEEESVENDKSGKYISQSDYKKRLKGKS